VDRAQANRRVVQPIIEPFSLPVFGLLPDGEPDYHCTGFFLGLGESLVLITAGHCLGDIRPHVFTRIGSCRELIGERVFARDTLPYHDPVTDIATVRLSAAEAESINPHHVIPSSAIAPFEYRNESFSPYLIMGVQEAEQKMQHANKNWRYARTSLMIGSAEPRYYEITKFRRERMMLFDARPSTYRSATGSGGVPKLTGMSGAPVWRYNPEESYSVQNYPPLVGMFVGKPSSTPKVAMAVRMGPILEHLSSAYEDLRGLLPRFPSATS
jgi:hypothetical protein